MKDCDCLVCFSIRSKDCFNCGLLSTLSSFLLLNAFVYVCVCICVQGLLLYSRTTGLNSICTQFDNLQILKQRKKEFSFHNLHSVEGFC